MVTIPCQQNALVTRKLWETSSKSTLSRRLCLGGPTNNKAIFWAEVVMLKLYTLKLVFEFLFLPYMLLEDPKVWFGKKGLQLWDSTRGIKWGQIILHDFLEFGINFQMFIVQPSSTNVEKGSLNIMC